MIDSIQPLWPKPIPIIGGTGAYESGKTMFGLMICPGPQTVYYDFEQSGAGYSELGHHRINVMAEMQKLYPSGYGPIDLFKWWVADIKRHQPGQYRVCILDPITDLERGLTDWVHANPKHFGHTAAQYDKMSGIMWGDVKDYMKSILADLSARFETLYFTAHLGKEFIGNNATGKLKMKGKQTLSELANLFLWFNRDADKNGVKPNKPSATVVKSRLVVMKSVDDEVEIYGVLPPKMPVCTPKVIREAFKNPAGGREIDNLERDIEPELTPDQRLKLEATIAEAKLADAEKSETQKPIENESIHIIELKRRIDAAETMEELKEIGATLSPADKFAIRDYATSRGQIIKAKKK